MGVPIIVFAKFVARSEYYQLGEQDRGAPWWKLLGEVGKQEQAEGVQGLAGGRSITNGSVFYNVKKYPDMESYLKWARIWNSRTQFQKYFDITMQELFCADDDLKKALGEMHAEKPTW